MDFRVLVYSIALVGSLNVEKSYLFSGDELVVIEEYFNDEKVKISEVFTYYLKGNEFAIILSEEGKKRKPISHFEGDSWTSPTLQLDIERRFERKSNQEVEFFKNSGPANEIRSLEKIAFRYEHYIPIAEIMEFESEFYLTTRSKVVDNDTCIIDMELVTSREGNTSDLAKFEATKLLFDK